ncbi:hypothetical protein B1812_15215 [Methylocystis bryophila]|uniref:Uncharacterized protein n=1 Tax=Methylocystis bryophila TaxID=655015 RepID=A0A1W6MXB0_9HYPH|nr:hypothetical protein B1812_15215 [Methylocystis bryophila]
MDESKTDRASTKRGRGSIHDHKSALRISGNRFFGKIELYTFKIDHAFCVQANPPERSVI